MKFMYAPGDYLNRLDNVDGLDTIVYLQRSEGMLHPLNSDCTLDGPMEKVHLLEAVRTNQLCQCCWKGLTPYHQVYLNTLRNMTTEQYQLDGDPQWGPWKHLSVVVGMHSLHRYLKASPVAVAWMDEIKEATRNFCHVNLPRAACKDRKDLALAYALQAREGAWDRLAATHGITINHVRVLKNAEGDLADALTQEICNQGSHTLPTQPHRPQNPGEDFSAYVAAIRKHHVQQDVASSLQDLQSHLTEADLEPVLAVAPSGNRARSENTALLMTSHHIAIHDGRFLIYGPRIVTDAILQSPDHHHAPILQEYTPERTLTPEILKRIREMWDSNDEFFGNLPKLVEAASLIR